VVRPTFACQSVGSVFSLWMNSRVSHNTFVNQDGHEREAGKQARAR
jgi:hypothetical protein